MHDASNKGTTIEALPQIIEAIQDTGRCRAFTNYGRNGARTAYCGA